MRKMFKKMCIGACGLMFVPILAMVPVNAENASSTQVPIAATGSIEVNTGAICFTVCQSGSDSIGQSGSFCDTNCDTGSWRV